MICYNTLNRLFLLSCVLRECDTGMAAGFHFMAHQFALRWAKENLPEEKYQRVAKSYRITFKRTLIFVVVCCIPVLILFLSLIFCAPFSQREEANATPEGATGYVLARVDYDGNFYWTHDSKKYEFPLNAYGLAPQEYGFGDQLKVYVDDAQNIIQVTAVEEGLTTREVEILVGIVGGILAPVLLIFCVYYPIASRTFARPWREFYREFHKK